MDYLTKQRVKKLIPEGPMRGTARFLYRKLRLACHQISPKDYKITRSSGDGSYSLEFNRGELAGSRIIFPPADFLDTYFLFSVSEEMPGYFKRKPREADLVMDVGSFPGDFAVLAASLIGKKVYAFEPDPENYDYTQEMIYANGLRGRVEAIRLGIFNTNGRTMFRSDGVGSRICSGPEGNGICTVELTTIDDFLSDFSGRKPFIKMDIEGHEIEAVDGAPKTFQNGSEWSIASYHLVNGEQTYHRLERFFQECGYQTEIVYPRHLTLNAWK